MIKRAVRVCYGGIIANAIGTLSMIKVRLGDQSSSGIDGIQYIDVAPFVSNILFLGLILWLLSKKRDEER